MENLMGIKELYDINIRLNEPIKIGNRHYDINETILSFEKAELSQVEERKQHKQATGGYHNKMLIDWEYDTGVNFSISHGILSPNTWAILSNSNLKNKNYKSVPYKETVNVIEDKNYYYADLKYIPNHIDKKMGLQGNPENEAMPMGRKDWLPLKPLPPERHRFIFCYDVDTGQRILKFSVCGNRIYFKAQHRKIMVDYTFDYKNEIVELNVGDILLNGFLNLTGKMTTKDYKTGETKTVILEIPKIKIYSNLSITLGQSYDNAVVSNFYFTGYAPDNKYDDKIFNLIFLNHELTGDYV